jgi:hypothetical protein
VVPDKLHFLRLSVGGIFYMLINRGVSRVHTEEETRGQDPDTPDDHNGVDVGGGVSDQPGGVARSKEEVTGTNT